MMITGVTLQSQSPYTLYQGRSGALHRRPRLVRSTLKMHSPFFRNWKQGLFSNHVTHS